MVVKHFLNLIGLFLLSGFLKAQKPEITALNRVTLNRHDTVYQFFTIKQVKKIKLQNDLDYYWYVPDTILITRVGFDGKLLHGSYKVFYPDKNLRETGSFTHGVKTGEWKAWYTKGKLRSIINWKDGKRDGSFEEYNEKGKKIRSGMYHNDLLSGRITEYNDDDSIKETEYKDGQPIPEKHN